MVVAAVDVAVLGSDNEGTPVSLIEAAASARPTVATAVAGVPDVVTPATGLIVPPADPRALGEALTTLTGDAERRRRLGAAGCDHVRERYNASTLVADVDWLYCELLAVRARG